MRAATRGKLTCSGAGLRMRRPDAYDPGPVSVDRPPRFVIFLDDEESLERSFRYFGEENVLAVSERNLGSRVLTFQRETLAEQLSEIARSHRSRPFSAVVYWREPHVLLAGALARRLGLPGALPEPLLARDKLRMKDALRQSVRCADCRLVRNEGDLFAMPSSAFPAVLKPRFGFASLCAVRVENREDAYLEYREKRDKLVTTHIERVDLCIPEEPEFVIESFIGGTEHTVESFVADGEVTVQIVSDKEPMAPPHFVETGDRMPSALDEPSQDLLREAARRGIAALGIQRGWTHAEVKLCNGEAWVMEIAARMGGGYTRELVRAAYGLDMLGAWFDFVRWGKRPTLGPVQAHAQGQRFVVPGVAFVWALGGTTSPDVLLVERESSRRRRGLVLGTPYSYEGTIAAYILRAASPPALDNLRARIAPMLAPRFAPIRIPRGWYGAYLRAKRALDDVRRH